MKPSRKGPLLRLSAWITLQAFLFTQIPPTFARAETLRAQSSEGTPAAGLEAELSGRPESGFTTAGVEQQRKALRDARFALGGGRSTASVSGVRIKLENPRVEAGAKVAAALYGYTYLRNLHEKWKTAGQPKSKLRLVLGGDSRSSGAWLAPEIARGWIAAARELQVELEILNLSVLAKPILLESLRAGDFNGGIDLTASHNDMMPIGPVEFNGWEMSTGAREPPGATLDGGGLLSKADATQVIRATDDILENAGLFFPVWARIAAVSDEDVQARMDLSTLAQRHGQSVETYWEYAKRSARKNFGIDLGQLPELMERARKEGRLQGPLIVFDANGSAATEDYPALWRRAGLTVEVINPQMAHSPTPEGKNLNGLKEEVQKRNAGFGIAVDADSDRAVGVIGLGTEQPAIVPEAQVASTVMVGMSMTMALESGRKPEELAVVVNDASSMRIRTVLKVLGVSPDRLREVEVGEANLVEEQQHWERQGAWAMASELSNGGLIYPEGLSRDGAMLGFVLAYLALDPMPYLKWLERSGQLDDARRDAIQKGNYTLADIVVSFPWAGHPNPEWRWITGETGDKEAKLTLPSDVQPHAKSLDPLALKQRMIELFETDFWPQLRDTWGYESFRILHADGRKTTEGKDIPAGGGGGFRIEMTRNGEAQAKIWMRTSGTEPGVIRDLPDFLEIDGRGREQEEELYRIARELFGQAARVALGKPKVTAGVEDLSQDQILDSLNPLLNLPVAQWLILDSDGVVVDPKTMDRLPESIVALLDRFAATVQPGRGGIAFLTNGYPVMLDKLVLPHLTQRTAQITVPLASSGALNPHTLHVLPEAVLKVFDRWIDGLGGIAMVLDIKPIEMEVKQGYLSQESLQHGYGVVRVKHGDPASDLNQVIIPFKPEWLEGQLKNDKDALQKWDRQLRDQLKQAGVPDDLLRTLPSVSQTTEWVRPKMQTLQLWATGERIAPETTWFIDDSARHHKGINEWAGARINTGKFDKGLKQFPGALQVVPETFPAKPSNGISITETILQVAIARREGYTGNSVRELLTKAGFLPEEEVTAGMEAKPIPLNKEKAANNFVILGPNAMEIGIPALARLQRHSSGEQGIQFAVIVEDRAQRSRARSLLNGLQWTQIIVLSQKKEWTLDDAIQHLEEKARERGLTPQTIRKPEELEELGRLLVPADYQPIWNERVNRQAGLETQM